MLKLAEVFSDHMLIQRGQPVKIWGQAASEETVTIRLGSQEQQTSAAENGSWHVVFDPLPAQRDVCLCVKDHTDTLVVQDIAVGDLFLAAGQSNMEFMLENEVHFQEAKKRVQGKDVRVLYVPQVEYPQQKIDRSLRWKVLDETNLAADSAVAVYALLEMKEHLDVPLGIVECYKGGTSASCWISEQTLEADKTLGPVFYEQYWNGISGQSEEEEDRKRTAYQKEVARYQEAVAEYQKTYPDRPMSQLKHELGHTPWPGPKGKKDFGRPSGLHDTMFSRIADLNYKAVWWYQGEEDTKNADLYDRLLGTLIDAWRTELGSEVPFFLVQLPSYIEETYPETWPLIRRAQFETAHAKNGVSVLCTIDLGDQYNIHPTDKLLFGKRLGDLCLAVLYGIKENAAYPRLVSYAFRDGLLELVFENIENGEIILDTADASIKAPITEGRSVVPLPAGYVSYAWKNNVEHPVFNEHGLPMFPFLIKI